MTSRVDVSPEVISWALKRSGAAEPAEKKFPKLQEWLRGESQPTMRQLEDLARATLTPLGFFFLSRPPEEKLPIPFYRTHDSKIVKEPSPNLLETVHTMERRQEWMREYLVKSGFDGVPLVGAGNLKSQPEQAAEQIRKMLDLQNHWASKESTWTAALSALRDKADKAGVLVVVNGIVGNNTHRKLDPSEFRGFVLIDDLAPLIFINGADSKAAQMFTLAHELAHVLLGKSAAFDLREMLPASDETELVCNQIAAEFLVPQKELLSIWSGAQKSGATFEYVARHFKVSQLVSARRALDCKLISKGEFFSFYREYQEQEYAAAGTKSGGDFYVNQNQRIGKRFAKAVVRAVREGNLLHREAYHLTGLYGKTFSEYANVVEALP